MNSYFAKQPILDVNGKTYGYELLFRNSLVTYYDGTDGDRSTADVINSVFFGASNSCYLEDKKAFIIFTENLLFEKTALLLPQEMTVIEIPENISVSESMLSCCKELYEKGYTIALSDYVYREEDLPLLEYVQIVKLDFRRDRDDIDNTAEQCLKLNKTLLAEKVETVEGSEYAKEIGCTYMQGFYYAQPMIVAGKAYNPMVMTFTRLVNCLWQVKVDVKVLSAVISEDPFMAAKLLRLVNAVRGDMSEHISSIKQAILLLGINKLKDWIYLLGLQSLAENGPDERIKAALFRAIFCKRIAEEYNPKNAAFAEEMYLMGLMSIVVDRKDTETMDTMKLSENITGGLLGKEGIFGDTMKFAENYERGNWLAVDNFGEKYNIDGKTILKLYTSSVDRVEEIFGIVKKYQKD